MGGNPSTANKDDLAVPDDDEEKDIFIPKPYYCHFSNTRSPTHNKVNHEVSKNFITGIADMNNKEVSDNENYGILPLVVVHSIMLYSEISDIFSIILTCRLFYVAFNNSFFWKSYCEQFFQEEEIKTNITEDDIDKVNWKEVFFKRYFSFSNEFYKKKYKKAEYNEDDYSKEENDRNRIVFKLNVIGERLVGKTALVTRFLHGNFVDETNNLPHAFHIQHLEYATMKKGKAFVRLEIWDQEPQRPYRNINPMFYRGSDCGLITFGIDSLKEFELAKRWVKEYLITNWNPEYGRLGTVVLVGMKNDLDTKREVLYDDHIKTFLLYENSKYSENKIPYIEVSAKKNWNISKVFGMAIDLALDIRNKHNEKKRKKK